MAPTIDELAKRLDALEKENKELRSRIDSLSASLSGSVPRSGSQVASDGSITQEDVSGIMEGFISNFNSNAERSDAQIGYMISDMEIELKTQVVKDGDRLKLKTADRDAVPETVSTVKMAVRAVPGGSLREVKKKG